MADRILVIGSGACEESLCRQLAQSVLVKQVLFAPGNEGMPDSGKVCKSAVLTNNPAILKQFCKDHNIGLVVVSPISLLTAGLIDDLSGSGVRCFGPIAKAALLEANKSIAKDFMQRHGIPTARWKSFSDPHKACSFITYADFPALVVKASAVTSGKDWYIARDRDEACRAVQQLTQDWTVGQSAATLIVEERLEGEEYYCLCVTDGITLAPLPFLHIQKQGVNLNEVPQLASSGFTQLSDNVSKMIHKGILQKAGDALRKEGWSYTGLFGAKIMVTEKGPVVLGLKCTFQDLESQTISPLLKSDLYGVMQAATEGRLCSRLPVWTHPEASASPRQQGKHNRHQDLEMFCTDADPVSSDLVSSGETAFSSSKEDTKQTTLVAFPGSAYRKDGASVTVGRQGRNRRNVFYPDEIHQTQEPASDPEQAGSTAMTDAQQLPNRCDNYIEVNLEQYMDPIIVCTTNSIGDKIKVAQACNLHKLAAQNMVTTCINDLLSKGAQAIYFMPYFACGNLPQEVIGAIAEGLAEGCRRTGSTLLDRGMTPLPGASSDGGYSLFGCAVSVMERRHRLPRLEQMREGDALIGVQSHGVHSSSLSLLGDILQNHSLQFSSVMPMGNGATTWGEMILSSDMVYSPSLLRALQSAHIRACVPIADGGLVGSILRCLPEAIAVIIDALCWKIPAVFSWLYKEGGLSEQELVCHFGCGIGAVLVVQGSAAQDILAELQYEQEAWLMGTLVQHHAGLPRIRVCHLLEALRLNTFQLLKTVIANKSPAKISHVAVLISPTGTKLKIMMDTARQLGSCVRLALIISDKTAVEELRRAAGAGIPTRVIDPTMFGCQSEFENTICKVLEEFSIHLICLAGFSRTLSQPFLNRWKGKLLKLYTTLFPSSKGEQRPASGARVCGCTVCFMLDGSSAGPIILQETVTRDLEVPLCEQMEDAEQRAVSKALYLVASGTLSLGAGGEISWKNVD